MYEVFDSPFLAMDTWSSPHPLDKKRFNQALAEVVRLPDFSADELGRHMRQKLGLQRDDGGPLNAAVDRYVAAAWAVRDYFAATVPDPVSPEE